MIFGITVALVGGLYLFLVYFTGTLSMQTADFRGDVGEKERVVADEDYRISNRDWFFTQCQAIAAKQDNIAITEQQIKTASGGYKQQLLGAKAAEQKELNSLVQEYNARAANEQSGGQWKDDELPAEINAEEEVTCGSE